VQQAQIIPLEPRMAAHGGIAVRSALLH